jgi:hypothetical protein
MATSEVRYIIIDFHRVTGISFDSCQTFTELLELAEQHHFTFIFTGLKGHITRSLLRAGVPMSFQVFTTDSLLGKQQGVSQINVYKDKIDFSHGMLTTKIVTSNFNLYHCFPQVQQMSSSL